jgi:hypothetical protein
LSPSGDDVMLGVWAKAYGAATPAAAAFRNVLRVETNIVIAQ